MAKLFALVAAPVALGLRGPAPTHPPPAGMDAPDIIVGGIGDTGTSAVIQGLEDLGLHHCHWHDNYNEPTYAHARRYEFVQTFLKNGNYSLSREAFMASPQAFKDAVALQRNIAQQEAWCVLKGTDLHVPLHHERYIEKNKPWGYMEPHYSWLLPVLDEAFSKKTNVLLVARDPRDLCNSTTNVDQFEAYGRQMNISDCYTWWATYWDQVFEHYGDATNVKIVRLEDLAYPQPKLDGSALAIVHCIARHAGLDKSSPGLLTKSDPTLPLQGVALLRRHEPTANRTAVWQELEKFQLNMKNNFRHQLHLKIRHRTHLISTTATRYDLYSTMRRLGYSPVGYETVPPEHPMVCRGA